MTGNRWFIYQRERFPILAHGLLIAAFSASAVGYSFLLRAVSGLPSPVSLSIAFTSAFIVFLQLRIADEFKDFEEDSRYRPYRPVPRGLVKLGELALIAAVGAAIQLILALWLAPGLVPLLLAVWAYLALMTREFFVRDWICQRPITYLWTHMLILPLADFYATACDWRIAQSPPPSGLQWFIATSFFNGVTLELGRKIRAPGDEEEGVRTYSRLWGCRNASLAWASTLWITAACSLAASAGIGFLRVEAMILGTLAAVGLILAWRFGSNPDTAGSRWINHFSGVWTLILYLSLGILPFLWRINTGP